MAGPDLKIDVALARATNAVDLTLSQPARAVDASDRRDGLSPRAWVLSGEGAPSVVLVTPDRTGQPVADRAARFRLHLDGELAPGRAYTVAPAPMLAAAAGQAVDATPASFSGPLRLPRAGAIAGVAAADIASPPQPSAEGGPALVDRATALEERCRLRARTRRKSFGHMPQFGRDLEPKRTNGPQVLAREGLALKTDLLRDPEVSAARVSISQPSPGVVDVEMIVQPTFSSKPLVINESLIIAGVQA